MALQTIVSLIGHTHLPLCNPLSPTTLHRTLHHLPTPQSALDAACGRADVLIHLADRFGLRGLGVDRSPAFLAEARARVGARDLRVELADLESWTTDERFDLLIMIGGPWETLPTAWSRLQAWGTPGAWLLWGGPLWERRPATAWLDALGVEEERYRTDQEHHRDALAIGLQVVHRELTTQEEWDHYEDTYAASVEAWAEAHPDDPDTPAMLDRVRTWRRLWLSWGRGTLGFGLYLLRPAV